MGNNDDYLSPQVGHQITAVLLGVSEEIIRDGELLWRSALESLKADEFTVLHQHVHLFEPVGVTGSAILSESHMHIHSYPHEAEGRSVVFNLYSCLGEWHGEKTLAEFLRLIPCDDVLVDRIPVPITKENAHLMPNRSTSLRLVGNVA